MPRKMGPLSEDHPLVIDLTAPRCHACQSPFYAGEYVTLVTLGPGDDEGRKLRDAGLPYSAVAIPIHWECSDKEEA